MLFGTEIFELEILKIIHGILECDFMDFLMPVISRIGNIGVIWVAAGLILMATKKYRKTGIKVLIGLFVGLIVGNVFLKNVIARPRPCWLDTGVELLIASPTDFSFPSGHTLSSFIAAFIINQDNKKMGIWAFALAVLMAFSRLYLFVHFPTDILGGVLLAWAINKTLNITKEKLLKKR